MAETTGASSSGHSARAASQPDLMNDPRYATNSGRDDGPSEADTCRICRGEATETEQLFYPCKCSGSIKFVHQDCLMEWLSHSQKKYCELCKTPFRFTKLYDATMPQRLPTSILVRHLAIHVVRNIATWLRCCLVVAVWLGWLPWTMRQVWGFLFWFGDGGWTAAQFFTAPMSMSMSMSRNSTAIMALSAAREQLEKLTGNGTSPATPLMAEPTSAAVVGEVLNGLPLLLRPFSQSLNFSDGYPLAAGFVRAFFYSLGLPILPDTALENATQVTVNETLKNHNSLLSDVKFLRTLTPHSGINKIIIGTLEGQIITVLVVICFILIFLIREWVVQQQPGINMGAGFNADMVRMNQPWNRNVLPEPAAEAEAAEPAQDNNEVEPVQRPQAVAVPAAAGERPIARPRQRVVRLQVNRQNLVPGADDPEPAQAQDTAVSTGVSSPGLSSGEAARPGMPPKESLSPALDIQRSLAEGLSDTGAISDSQIGVREFIAIWRRAGGRTDEVMKIIREEGLQDKLQYWINAIETLPPLETGPTTSGRSDRSILPPGIIVALGAEKARVSGSTRQGSVGGDEGSPTRTNESHTSSDSWVDVSSTSADSEHESNDGNDVATENSGRVRGSGSSSKGKGLERGDLTSETIPESNTVGEEREDNSRILSESDEISRPNFELADSREPSVDRIRPRAFSDGPQRRSSAISPLATNSWTFAGLDKETNASEAKESSASIAETDHQAWKDNQSRRVQEAIRKAREAKSAQRAEEASNTQQSSPADPGPTESTPSFEVQRGSEVHVRDNWDDVFAENPVPETDSDSDGLDHDGPHDEAQALQPQQPNPPPVVQRRRDEPQGLLAQAADWLWGDMEVQGNMEEVLENDEQIVDDLAAEAPFVPVGHANGGVRNPAEDQDRDVAAAAFAAGVDPNDPDAIDDAEDFEGIMELVGMRGPLTGLIQNGMFSAVLISLTVACGVWIPYNIGRLVLLFVAYPIPSIKLPLKILFSMAAFVQDLALVIAGAVSWLVFSFFALPATSLGSYSAKSGFSFMVSKSGAALRSWDLASTGGHRISDGVYSFVRNLGDSEVPAFSALSHESLLMIKNTVSGSMRATSNYITVAAVEAEALNGSPVTSGIFMHVYQSCRESLIHLSTLPSTLSKPGSWVISLDLKPRDVPLDTELAQWGGMDRFWAILAGYAAISFLGSLYLRRGRPFSKSQVGKEWEAAIIDLLHQAGGVMKVILIISIEMLVFPLYCGLLLDFALLPLFENVTIISRIAFTMNSPLTSIFVHWFVGTCYMFHFALFVSMCRKIMRTGVLYFIRDPDDPTFHPVRDVLERNVATQLRKITFSAMVYGALVVVCLGGVVWGLAFAFNGVLPIHWSSNEPVLEFPIDLLFYNFFMPLAVKFFKPSDGLHAMYSWWFRKCARMLRLTWFLFGERQMDEEGYQVRRTWGAALMAVKGDVEEPLRPDYSTQPFERDATLEAYFHRDGRYVRAPSSDQVRIPKGTDVFLEVDVDNARLDGLGDNDEGLHGRDSEQFKKVYVPPHFRTRISLFILFIWVFAAVTGVCITIMPLVFGRRIFSLVIPEHVHKNDIYAFSIGIYVLGSALYALVHVRQGLGWLQRTFAFDAETPMNVARRAAAVALRVLRVVYTYSAFALVIPALFSLVVEFYLIVPLHTYFASSPVGGGGGGGGGERHVVHLVQSWTLGLLYVKLTTRLILWHENSRPAEALREVTRNGYTDPDARLATRCFILPAVAALSAALLAPLPFAWLLARLGGLAAAEGPTGLDPQEEFERKVYRYAYPMLLSLSINAVGVWALVGVLRGWRQRVKDEVYLVGERLHNFGERKAAAGSMAHGSVGGRNRIEA